MSGASPSPPAGPSPSPAGNQTATPLVGRHREGWVFSGICLVSTWFGVFVLIVLLLCVLSQAWGRVHWQFISSYDSFVYPEKAGILGGLWGSIWLMILTMLFSVPVGVGAALYLEEYAADTWVTRLIRTNLANLAGVPSIVYGILGLTVFVRMFGVFRPGGLVESLSGLEVSAVTVLGVRIPLPFSQTVISGALALSLLILPVIIVAAQEAVRAVPPSIRHASLALGATRWETIRHQVLPMALPGILTGVILAISRAIGETAPLVMVGAAVFYRATPGGITKPVELVTHPQGILQAPFSEYTALPMQIYNWVKQPGDDYRQAAAAGILVLLTGLLLLNGLAIYIRNHFQKHLRG